MTVVSFTKTKLNIESYISYALYGKNGSGPTRENPPATRMQPANEAVLGLKPRSHNHPQTGAVNAYVPPFTININPKIQLQLIFALFYII